MLGQVLNIASPSIAITPIISRPESRTNKQNECPMHDQNSNSITAIVFYEHQSSKNRSYLQKYVNPILDLQNPKIPFYFVPVIKFRPTTNEYLYCIINLTYFSLSANRKHTILIIFSDYRISMSVRVTENPLWLNTTDPNHK